MKKLLFLTNLLCLSLLGSCQSNPKTVTTNETKPKTTVPPKNIDTTKTVSQTNSSRSVGTEGGIKKDTASKPKKVNAITHGSENQAKLDSIKKTKNKTKIKSKK
jgi:hypothetical protein